MTAETPFFVYTHSHLRGKCRIVDTEKHPDRNRHREIYTWKHMVDHILTLGAGQKTVIRVQRHVTKETCGDWL